MGVAVRSFILTRSLSIELNMKRAMSIEKLADTDTDTVPPGSSDNKRTRRETRSSTRGGGSAAGRTTKDTSQFNRGRSRTRASNDALTDAGVSLPDQDSFTYPSNNAEAELACLQSENLCLRSQVSDMELNYGTKIASLSSTVIELSNKVAFLLTFLGIMEGGGGDNAAPAHVVSRHPQPAPGPSASGIQQSDMLAQPEKETCMSSIAAVNRFTGRSFAEVVKTSVPGAIFKQTVISAVYQDMKDIERRTRNVVVSGLKPVTGSKDMNVISDLLCSEFCRSFDIVSCKRLGAVNSGKIQPLLLSFRGVEDATFLIDNAKSLRHSSNADIRKTVFINRDLTKAQAKAEFDRRCQLRNAKLRVTVKPTSGTESNSNMEVSACDALPGGSICNPDAAPFVPRQSELTTNPDFVSDFVHHSDGTVDTHPSQGSCG